MMPKKVFVLLVPLLLLSSLVGSPAMATSGSSLVTWQTWQDSQFDSAKREKRFVLLNLEAVWCHWCHVMAKETYSNPKVADYIKQHYIAVKIDQDSRPDLSKRYEDYGWPATVVFNAEGKEIVKLRGYIPPERMMAILTNIVEDPSPIVYVDQLRDNPTELSKQPKLTAELRAELTKRFYSTHDYQLGGMNQDQKFMDRDSVELALMLAQQGDKKALEMAMQTLDGALNLIDPVWGGAYQYSTDGDWDHKHFEKIMSVQADYLTLYSNAARITGEKRYEAAAKLIYRYVKEFLSSPEGGYFVSQDADLVPGEHSEDYFKLDNASRRALGFPRVDTHVYTRETGWMIAALTAAAQTFNSQMALNEAIEAAQWVEKNRSLPGGGFRHDVKDEAGPYLDDNLAMARAYLSLYVATADRQWLKHASTTASFIVKNFKGTKAGYNTAVKRDRLQPRPNVDENSQLARFFNELMHYTGNAIYRQHAGYAMRYIASEDIATFRRTEPGILLADMHLRTEPTHITVVGSKKEPDAAALYQAALKQPFTYRRIEWWDRAEGKMPNPDINYPKLTKPAAFVCTNKACSSPIYNVADMTSTIDRLTRNP